MGVPPVLTAEAPRRRAEDLILRLAVLAAFAATFFLPVDRLDRAGLVVCAFRRLTGLPCPGCGMTHACVAISHGNLAAALHYNALSFAVYAGGVLWLIWPLLPAALRGRLPAPPPRTRAGLWWAALAVTLAYGLFRILTPAARPF